MPTDIMINETGRLSSKIQPDPAADAAGMLLRLGFAVFALVIPTATLMSRWVIVVLVPIGAVLIILAALVRGEPHGLGQRILAWLWSFPGLFAFFLALWSLASLGWTPFPAEAFEKLVKALGVILLGLVAAAALPQRMRASNLYLVTIGVALGALLILLSAGFDKIGIVLPRMRLATPGRVAVLLSILVWVGAAWMLIKNRRGLAAGLVVLVGLAIGFGSAPEALAPFLAGMLVLVLVWNEPERAGLVLGGLCAGLIMATPAFIGFVAMSGAAPEAELSAFAQWWGLAASEPMRLITGHGFDAAGAARAAGLLAQDGRLGLVADIWFDLGLLGAIGVGAVNVYSFRAAGGFGLELGPMALAALSASVVYAVLERGATQTWWLNGMVVFAIMLISMARGRYRTVRPRLAMTDAA